MRLLIDLPSLAEARPSLAEAAALEAHEVAFTGDTEALAAVRALAPDAMILMTWESPWLPRSHVLSRVRPQFFNQMHQLLTGRTIDAMHRRGLLVSTYTVDDPARMRRLARRGVDAIISNDIVTLQALTGRADVTSARL